MKKQKKLSLRAGDLTPLKNVTGGRHHRAHGLNAHGHRFIQRGDEAGLGPFGGLRKIQ